MGEVIHSAILSAIILAAPLSVRSTEALPSVSNAKARAVVQEGLDALGDEPTRTVSIHAEGQELRQGQGPNLGGSALVSRLAVDWKVDLRRKRLSFRREEFEGDNLKQCYQYTIAPQARFASSCRSDAVLALDLSSIADAWTAWMQQEYPEPSWQLAHAWSRVDTLEYLGEMYDQGVKQNVVSYATESGQRQTLYLNAENGLLTKVEGPLAAALVEDSFIPRIEYADYRREAGAMIPSQVTVTRRRGLEIVKDVLSLSAVRFDEPLSGSAFAPPQKKSSRSSNLPEMQ